MTPSHWRVHGGRTLYGQALGILMLDTHFPRLPGDVGNATTWPFPVHYRIVSGARQHRIMGAEPDQTLLEPFLEAARELEQAGVRAITTSCGFLACFQRELAAAVAIPVLTSALLQVPLVASLFGPGRKVGILTERAANLTERHFQGMGWSAAQIDCVVMGLPPEAVFPRVFIEDGREAEPAVLEREMVQLAVDLVEQHPDVGAIVSECTNFVPFSQAMRRASGRPVYDLYTLVMQTFYATVGAEFHGFL